MTDWRYLAVSLAAGLAVFFWCTLIDRLRNAVRLLDAAGLAFFCVAGAEKALAFGLEGGRWKDGYAVDGFRVPYSVTAWRIDPAPDAPVFAEQQALDLWFKDGTLAPQLSRADFVPAPDGK